MKLIKTGHCISNYVFDVWESFYAFFLNYLMHIYMVKTGKKGGDKISYNLIEFCTDSCYSVCGAENMLIEYSSER